MQSTGCPKLDDDFAAFDALAHLNPATAQELAGALGAAYTRLLTADLDDYDVPAIREHADHALDDMFLLRVALRDRIAEWHAQGLLDDEAERNLRGVFRIGRYATDMLTELIVGTETTAADNTPKDLRAFTGEPLTTLINPRHRRDNGFEFKSGDVLLVRGSLSTSAAIARIGDIDSQFSHVGVVHIGADGQPNIVEALIEKGAVVSPLDSALTHGLGRAVLLRPRDPDLGQAAADWVKTHVEASNTPHAPHIPYDFTMEIPNYASLFCSKLVRLAYDKASDGKVDLPLFATELSMSNRDFVDRIGVTARTTFAPGDLELDPHFDVVAEWRDVRKTSNLRLQDALMDKLFAWMDNHGYVYRESFKPWIVSVLGRTSSYLPSAVKGMLVKVGVPEVPRNMQRQTISAIAMLTWTSGPIVGELEKRDGETRKHAKRPMHLRDVYTLLEDVRIREGARIGYLVKPLKRRG